MTAQRVISQLIPRQSVHPSNPFAYRWLRPRCRSWWPLPTRTASPNITRFRQGVSTAPVLLRPRGTNFESPGHSPAAALKPAASSRATSTFIRRGLSCSCRRQWSKLATKRPRLLQNSRRYSPLLKTRPQPCASRSRAASLDSCLILLSLGASSQDGFLGRLRSTSGPATSAEAPTNQNNPGSAAFTTASTNVYFGGRLIHAQGTAS